MKDRIPILEGMIEKKKFFIVERKKYIERYIRNKAFLKEALNHMLDLLGVNNNEEFIIYLSKFQEQKTSIEFFESELEKQLDILQNKKLMLEEAIEELKVKVILN